MKGPSIFIGSLEIAEFMGVFTDILLAILNFYFASKLSKMGGESGTRKLLLWHFYLLAFSTFVGGVLGHGFLYALGMTAKIPSWLTSIGSAFALELVVLRLVGAHIPRKLYLFSAALATALALSTSILSIVGLTFLWVAVHTAFGLLFIVSGFGVFMIRKNLFAKAFKYFLMGVGFSALAAAIFALKIAPMEWFNHLDLSHVVLGIATWGFYLGAKELLQNTSESTS